MPTVIPNQSLNLREEIIIQKRAYRNIFFGNFGQGYERDRVYAFEPDCRIGTKLALKHITAYIESLLPGETWLQNIFVIYRNHKNHDHPQDLIGFTLYIILKPSDSYISRILEGYIVKHGIKLRSYPELRKELISNYVLIFPAIDQVFHQAPVVLICYNGSVVRETTPTNNRILVDLITDTHKLEGVKEKLDRVQDQKQTSPIQDVKPTSLIVNETNLLTKDAKRFFQPIQHMEEALELFKKYAKQKNCIFFKFRCYMISEIGPILLNELLWGLTFHWSDIYLQRSKEDIFGVAICYKSKVPPSLTLTKTVKYEFGGGKAISFELTDILFFKSVIFQVGFVYRIDHKQNHKQNAKQSNRVFHGKNIPLVNKSNDKKPAASKPNPLKPAPAESSSGKSSNVKAYLRQNGGHKYVFTHQSKVSESKQCINLDNLETVLASELDKEDQKNKFVSLKMMQMLQYGSVVMRVCNLHTAMTVEDINELLGTRLTSPEQLFGVKRQQSGNKQLMDIMFAMEASNNDRSTILAMNKMRTLFETTLVVTTANMNQLERFLIRNHRNYVQIK